MALIVETGAGLPDAEAYVSVADFKAMCDRWGYAYAGFTDEVIEQKLRLAAAFIDTVFRYKAQRLLPGQAMEFPRTGMTDWSGYEVTGVPARVIKANVELASKALVEPLYTDLDRGGQVTSESVGPISVSYAEGAPVGKMFRFAEQLLKPYIRVSGSDMTGPRFETPGGPAFGFGMHDNEGIGLSVAPEE